jgi:MFS superfamily sulfate permease-like transporter
VEWILVDASSVNVMDITAIQKIDELREKLAALGIRFFSARVKQSLLGYFGEDGEASRKEANAL